MQIEGIEIDEGRPMATCDKCGESWSYPNVHFTGTSYLLEGLCQHCGHPFQTIEVGKEKATELFGSWIKRKGAGA